MNYYKRHIGDYAKKAGRLSIIQHGVYTLLIDSCYDRECFPTLEKAIDWVWASSQEEIDAVSFVLNKFFSLKDGVYQQKRIVEEIETYHKNAKTNKRIAQESWAKRKQNDTVRIQGANGALPNHKPLTKNHKPITSKDIKTLVIPSDVVDLFNKICIGLPKIKTLSEARKKSIARLSQKDIPNINAWEAYFEKVQESDYLTGKVRDWKATFDWLLKPANMVKVAEGNYDNKKVEKDDKWMDGLGGGDE